MGISRLFATSVAALGLVAGSAVADIVNTTLVPASGSNAGSINKLAIQGTVLGGAVPIGFAPAGGAAISGTANFDLNYDNGPLPIEPASVLNTASINNGIVGVQDFTLNINLAFLGAINAGATGVGGVFLPGTPNAVTSDGDGGGSFDLGGTTLSLNSGTIALTTSGFVATLLPSTTLNLGASPLNFSIGAGQGTGSIDIGPRPLVPGTALVTFTSSVVLDVAQLLAAVAGTNTSVIATIQPAGSIWLNLQSTGSIATVPEVGSMLLLAAASFGVTGITVVRRRRRSA